MYAAAGVVGALDFAAHFLGRSTVSQAGVLIGLRPPQLWPVAAHVIAREAFIVAGVVAISRRPRNRVGYLMVAAGVAWMLPAVGFIQSSLAVADEHLPGGAFVSLMVQPRLGGAFAEQRIHQLARGTAVTSALVLAVIVSAQTVQPPATQKPDIAAVPAATTMPTREVARAGRASRFLILISLSFRRPSSAHVSTFAGESIKTFVANVPKTSDYAEPRGALDATAASV